MRPREPRKSDTPVNRAKARGIADYEAKKKRENDRSWLKQKDPFEGYQPRSPYSGSYVGTKGKPPVKMPKPKSGGAQPGVWY
jgi:hypothetical protein